MALRINKIPRYERIRSDILEKYIENISDISLPIPSEKELAEEFNVSIGTIRKAINELVEEQILYKIQGRGTFIKRPDFANSFIKFFKYRIDNNTTSFPQGKVTEVAIQENHPEIARTLNLPPDARLLFLKRERRLNKDIFIQERIWVPADKFSALRKLKKDQFDNQLYPLYADVCNIIINSAKERLSFFHSSENEALVKIIRIASDIKGEPVEYRESIGKAGDFAYEITIP